ncbi:hypothetical protein HOT49_gp037 [Erwinia phage vB_EamM_Alexandra]|uniref:Uncharacterized protein n=1 Tax=Erwinia phage vB_EamM_Alexandra TaxID=2201424 RepID=A0A2Z4QDX5_9CAUD|nr:hypothetical protein HOT49_gp037 [Erwinia phage vB_EamM_Alexandra]AWY08317.1 hypothetical protein Alexandra_37 [Erwinia phage vB_EamM_Alexandra]
MLIDILKAVPAIVLCYIIWRWLLNKRDHKRNLERAHKHYMDGDLKWGNVWIHRKSGRPYTVLWLTNTGTTKSDWKIYNDWEINVVYTHDFQQIYSRPYGEFCQKFFHTSRGQNEEHFDKILTEVQMINNTRLELPREGEMWFEGTVHATPPELVAKGHAAQVVSQRRARIDLVLGVGEAHPVVVYTVNDKQTAMLLSQFIFIFRKEVSFDGTVSSCI